MLELTICQLYEANPLYSRRSGMHAFIRSCSVINVHLFKVISVMLTHARTKSTPALAPGAIGV